MPVLRVACPAKINWSLRVLHRRPDGYHEIETLYQAVDLHDSLRVEPAEGMTLTCDDPSLPTGEANLVLRAARRLRDRAAKDGIDVPGARIHLAKRIPAGGGLGGGSSDAAGTLLALDSLWGLHSGRERLSALAEEIGSDVPFFLYGGTALGTGRGERIAPGEPAGEVPILLGLPPFGISTAEVYGRLRGRLTLPRNDVSLSRLPRVKLPGGKDFGPAFNDLEEVVLEAWPDLSTFRNALLDAGASIAMLSGSGSTVFGTFETSRAMSAAAGGLRARFGSWSLVETRAIEGAVHLVP